MGEMWRRFFDCGVLVVGSYPEGIRGEYPMLEACRKIFRDDFFTAAEIVPPLDPLARTHLVEEARSAGVVLAVAAALSYFQQGIRPAAADRALWEQSLEGAKRLVDVCIDMRVGLQQVTAGSDPGPDERPAARRRLVDFYLRLCEYAVERQPDRPLKFTLEPTDREIQIKGLIGPTEEAIAVIESVRRQWPNMGLTLDMAHIPQVGESLEQAVETGKAYLDHVHIANTVIGARDHPQYGDQHPQFGVPGGEFDVPDVARFIRALLRAGFFKPQSYGPRPIVSAEVRPGPGEAPDLVLAATKRKLRAAFASVRWPVEGSDEHG
jgi:sugar phosphate isomerase/epimerase